MIHAQAITVTRQGKHLLEHVDITVNDGEMIGVVGPNGSGKTTLLRSLYGACVINGGKITLDGTAMEQLSRRAIARRIAVVPQGQALDGDQTVGDMVALGRLPHQAWFASHGRRDDLAVREALDRVGLRTMAHRSMHLLSGGEVQRALVARALCQEADHLLLDEPTNHLDLGYQHDILAFIRELGLATLVVLHDLNLAARYCDRILLLDKGRLVAGGTTETVLTPARISKIYGVQTTRIATPAGRHHLVFADASTQDPK